MENKLFGLTLAIVCVLGLGFLISLGSLVYAVVFSDISIEKVTILGTVPIGLGFALAKVTKLSFSWNSGLPI